MITVLYISDNAESHSAVSHHLEHNGTIKVKSVFSKDEAGLILQFNSIDLIITDSKLDTVFFDKVRKVFNIPAIMISDSFYAIYMPENPNDLSDNRIKRSNEADYSDLAEIIRTTDGKAYRSSDNKDKDLLLTFFNNPLTGAGIISKDDRWLYVNDQICEISGYGREDLLKMKWSDLIPVEDLTGDPLQYRRMIGGVSSQATTENRYIRKDGSLKHVRQALVPVRNCYDEIAGYAIYIYDITRQKKAEEDLKKKNCDLTDTCRKLSDAQDRLKNNYDELTEKTIELLLSEEKFRAIFEKSPLAIALIGTDLSFITVNKKFLDLLGYSREDLMGITFTEVIHPVPTRSDISMMNDVIAGKIDEYQSERQYIRKDGTFIWGSLSISAIKNKKGRIVGIIALVNDISERKIAEESLARSEELHRSLFQASPSGIVYLGNDGIVTTSSPVVHTLLHLSSGEEVNGTSIFDWIVPGDLDRVRADIGNMMKGNACIPGVYGIVRKDGTQFLTEISAALVYRKDGTVNGMVALIRDITERITAETALRESEEKYRSLMENLNVGIFRSVFDQSGLIIEANTFFAQLFGFESKEELKDISLKDLYANPEDRLHIYKMTRSSGHIARKELQMRKKDGSVFWVSVTAHLPGFPEVEPRFVEGIIEDITEKKHSEEIVRSANRKLNLLSSITRHDILNQIMALQAYQELLRDHLEGSEEKELLEKQIHIAGVIERQISFTREYQQMGLEVPVWQDARRIIEKARSHVNTGNIGIDINISGIEILADGMFVKVFDNLIENAVRYGDTITGINFCTRKTPCGLVLSCEDDGIGIRKDEKEMIFQRGYGQNTGLGLFLAREILSISGISIRETGEPGKGARFEIDIPQGAYRFI